MSSLAGDLWRPTRRNFLRATVAATLAAPASRAWADPSATAKRLHYHTETPANAEPALADLVKNWLTPLEYFYIRSHAPVPQLDAAAYRLSIAGLVQRPLSLSLAELRDLADADVVATLTCAGNRRSELNQIHQVEGVPWNEGPIGNARWGGVRLSTLLQRAGLQPGARHVWFEGLDAIERSDGTIPFGASIPLEKALRDTAAAPGALVATAMNGQPLTGDHGYPARTVVPGYIGARSVKWLGKIVVSDRPSPNYFVQDTYKIVPDDDKLRMAEAAPIYAYVLNSVICTPASGAVLAPGPVSVAGYALAAGRADAAIARVEVSVDGGHRWRAAELTGDKQPYCWRLWRTEVELRPGTRHLLVRAHDTRGEVQPRQVDWNAKGYLFNAWHQVAVQVES